MEFKGTKGEWFIRGNYITSNTETIVEHPECNLPFDVSSNKVERAYANAKLIAAAPDLLEALQKIAVNSNDHAMIRIAIKAIQKALK